MAEPMAAPSNSYRTYLAGLAGQGDGLGAAALACCICGHDHRQTPLGLRRQAFDSVEAPSRGTRSNAVRDFSQELSAITR